MPRARNSRAAACLAFALAVVGVTSGCHPHSVPAPRVVSVAASRIDQPWSPADVNPAGSTVPSLAVTMTTHIFPHVFYWSAEHKTPATHTDKDMSPGSVSSIQALTPGYMMAPDLGGQYTYSFTPAPGSQPVSAAMRDDDGVWRVADLKSGLKGPYPWSATGRGGAIVIFFTMGYPIPGVSPSGNPRVGTAAGLNIILNCNVGVDDRSPCAMAS